MVGQCRDEKGKVERVEHGLRPKERDSLYRSAGDLNNMHTMALEGGPCPCIKRTSRVRA